MGECDDKSILSLQGDRLIYTLGFAQLLYNDLGIRCSPLNTAHPAFTILILGSRLLSLRLLPLAQVSAPLLYSTLPS